jgi:hypothetical protein
MQELKGDVDLWKVGKMNHNRELENKIDWAEFLQETEKMLAGENVYIKKDLEKYRQVKL